jgi:hypothetical protein
MANTQVRSEQVLDGTVKAVDLDLGLTSGQVNALIIPVDTTTFTKNLSSADINIQHALNTIDQLILGSGGPGTDELVKVGSSGTADYLNTGYFQQDSTNHIRILQNTLLSGVNADMLDGQHAPTGTIVGTTDSQTLTNKTLTSPIINSGAALTSTGPQIDNAVSLAHTRLHTITSVLDHSAGNWKVLYSNGSGAVTELSLGTAGQVLTSNGASAAPSFTTPTVYTPAISVTSETTLGIASSVGTSINYARQDHTHGSPTAATPVTQNPDQTNTTGNSTSPAAANHIHNIPTTTAVSISTNSNTQGSSTSFSRADHTHQLTLSSASNGDTIKFNGTNWVTKPVLHAMTDTTEHSAGNWQVFYSNGSGQVQELALGSSNFVLTSNGVSSAPSFTDLLTLTGLLNYITICGRAGNQNNAYMLSPIGTSGSSGITYLLVTSVSATLIGIGILSSSAVSSSATIQIRDGAGTTLYTYTASTGTSITNGTYANYYLNRSGLVTIPAGKIIQVYVGATIIVSPVINLFWRQ